MTKFGRYELLEELGRGGFGTVYKAEDQVLGRLVAIKILHPALLVETNFIERFRQEARTAAMLDHSNLVPVYDFGETEGRYYIAMGYMPGGSLKDLLKRESKLEPQRAYEVLAQVSEGLEYAHARGIIHRDLKPGNILFDDTGKARVADMGFAKVMSEGASRSMSTSGSLIGTPAYMAPETWRNKPASPQTDIYSLGCILYEMLTGKVLFEGDSPAEVMTRHVVDGPEYAPELSQGMRKVLNKALKREPEERYPDAKDFLADFKAMLRAEEIEPITPDPKTEPKVEKPSGPVFLKTTPETEPVIQEQIEPPFPTNDEPSEPGSNAINASNADQVEQLMRIGKGTIQQVAYSPDGSQIAVASSIGIYLYNSRTLEEEAHHADDVYIQSIAWSPDGKRLASGSYDNIIILWDADSGESLQTLKGHTNYVFSVAWSPDGKRLASGSYDKAIILWDADNGERLQTLEGHSTGVASIAWSPDGKRLMSGSYDNTIILWDADSGESLQTLEGHTSGVSSVAWSPDGKRLASGSDDNTVILWDADNGKRLQTLEGHTTGVSSVAWSPDGKRLASGSWDNTIILWDADSGERLQSLEGHISGVSSVAWSPDGKRLMSGSYDNTIILWDADSGERLQILEGHSTGVASIAWSPDGSMIVTGSYDGTIRLWGKP